jgi:hypothetical protein
MNATLIISGTLASICIFLFEKSQLKTADKRDKWVFYGFLLAVWAFSIVLSIFPNMPGPSQGVEFLFRPLGKLLEK